MPTVPYTVAIVLDPEFGDRIDPIASRVHAWVVDSPANHAAAEGIWQRNQDEPSSIENGVTTFGVALNGSRKHWCEEVLGTIDLHHGEDSHVPPLSVLEVYGLPFSEPLRSRFSEYDFTVFQPTDYGFRASKAPFPT
jgi:hypothetical protein